MVETKGVRDVPMRMRKIRTAVNYYRKLGGRKMLVGKYISLQ